jgi:membrane fusion protein, copper/silver efflux system
MKKLAVLFLSVLLACCTSNKKHDAQTSDQSNATGDIELSDQQIQLGNIQTDTIKNGSVNNQLVLTATVNFDQTKITAVSSRLMGRIEKLYFKNIGDYVRKGEPFFEIYSEELNNAKQEYLLAMERQKELDNSIIDFEQLVQSAKNKLGLWGMTAKQIEILALTKKASPVTVVYSTSSGYITSLDIQEGAYVMEGGTVMKLADLSTVWIEAQVYNNQLSQLNRKGLAVVSFPGISGLEQEGRIEFINPEVNTDSRINLIRVTVPNNHNQLKPGMPAYVTVKNPVRNMLILPADAVIRDSNGATVWIKTGKNLFKNKMVITGAEADNLIEITNGLQEGDIIVTSGAYLLNSEYIFKQGANPMQGHDMSNM